MYVFFFYIEADPLPPPLKNNNQSVNYYCSGKYTSHFLIVEKFENLEIVSIEAHY